MSEIPVTKGKSALVDDGDYEAAAKHRWYLSNGYACRTVTINGRRKMLRMHREILGLSDSEMCVDHVNHNRLDNRRSNLRVCNKSENGMNRPLLTNNTSGFKGVSWCKKTKRWQVKIRAQNQRYHIGLFDTAEEASAAYIAAALKLHGEFVNIGCEARTREEA